MQTHEPDEAEREIVQHARQQNWKVAVWDVANGLRLPGDPDDSRPRPARGDPLAALARPAGPGRAATAPPCSLLHNFHRFLNNPEVVQTTFAQLVAGKQQRTFLVVLSPVVQIPVELEKLFVVIEHALPDREQLQRIARETDHRQPRGPAQGRRPAARPRRRGRLTRYEAEGAFALSLTRHNAIRPEAIWELKAQTLKKNNLLTLHRGEERFDSLGGLANLKDFCRRALRPGKQVKATGRPAAGRPGSGQERLRQGPGQRDRPADAALDLGSAVRLAWSGRPRPTSGRRSRSPTP